VPPALDDLAAQVALTERRVAGDDPPPEHHLLEQRQGRLVLVGVGRDARLAQHAAGALVQGRQQVDRRGVGGAAAARRLAVDGHGAQAPAGGRPQQVVDPSGQRRFQRGGVEPGQQRLEGAEGGGPPAVAEPMHELDGLVAAPLGDGGDATASAEDGAAGVGEHGGQGMSAAVSGAGVGDIGQEGEQTAGWCEGHRGRVRVG